MKEEWPIRPLAEVCQIKPPKAEARRRVPEDALVSFVPMEDLGIDRKFLKPSRTKSLREVAGSYTYFADGDVLLAKITPCFENGKLALAADLTNGVGFGSSEYIVFRPDDTLDKEWLYYFLSRDDFRAEGAQRMTGAVGHKRVAKEFIDGYPIPLPPLSEQKRIVAILDEAFAGIDAAVANAEKNLANARELFESYLNSVFTRKGEGWVEKKLTDLSNINYGYTISASHEEIGPKFLRITDIQDKRVDWSTVPYCSLEVADFPKYRLENGDIVFARTGATTGKSYLVADPPKAVFASYLIRVQLNTDRLQPGFLYLFFQSESYWSSIRSGVSGSAQGGFNATKLGDLLIPYPESSMDQQSITARLTEFAAETQRLAAIYQQKLAALAELKQSILRKAFAGELTAEAGRREVAA